MSADSRLCSDIYRRGRRPWGGADEPTVELREDRKGVEYGRHERRTRGAVEGAVSSRCGWKKRRPARTSGRGGAERGQGQQYRNERRLYRDSHSPLPSVSFFTWAVVFEREGYLCAITSEMDLFVVGPVARRLALASFLSITNMIIYP